MQRSSTWLRSIAPAATLVATLGMAPLTAWAQQYPNQDIHFICAFPPGSGRIGALFRREGRPLTEEHHRRKQGRRRRLHRAGVRGARQARRLHGVCARR